MRDYDAMKTHLESKRSRSGCNPLYLVVALVRLLYNALRWLIKAVLRKPR